jgi:hypothetical protein
LKNQTIVSFLSILSILIAVFNCSKNPIERSERPAPKSNSGEINGFNDVHVEDEQCRKLGSILSSRDLNDPQLRSLYLDPLKTITTVLKKDSNSAQRARSCYWDQYLGLLQRIKVQSNSFTFSERQTISSSIAELHQIIQVANSKPFALSLDELLLNEKSQELLRSQNAKLQLLDFHTFFTFASVEMVTQNLPKILELSRYVQDLPELDLNFPFESLTNFLSVHGFDMPNENQKAYAKVLLEVLTRFGVVFSERGRLSQIAEFADKINELSEALRTKGLTDQEKRAISLRIQELKSQTQKLSILRYQIQNILSPIKKAWESSQTTSALDELEAMFDKKRSDLNFGLTFGSVTLNEGDIWIQTSEQGVGNLLVDMIEAPSAFTHSGYIAREEDLSGFPYYFRAEVSAEPKYSNLDLSHHAVFRITTPVSLGFTSRSLHNLTKLKSVSFDLLFKPGFVDDNNQALLYCSEFIHYLFKNRYLPRGISYTSPFDGADNKLPWSSATLKQNAKILGYDTEADYYLPDGLLYSQNTQFIGAFNSLTLGDEVSNPRGFLLAEVNAELSKKINILLREKILKKASLTDAILVQFGLGVWNSLSRIPFGQGLFPSELRRVLLMMDTRTNDVSTLLKVVLTVKQELDILKSIVENSKADASASEIKKLAFDHLEQRTLAKLRSLFSN